MSKNGLSVIGLQWVAAAFNVSAVVGHLVTGGSIFSIILHTLLCCVSVLVGSVIFVIDSEDDK